MDFETYRSRNFVDPPPAERFDLLGPVGITLYFDEFESAVRYYTEVLGPPVYVEGEGTRGWRLGGGWLTLLRGGDGAPRNVEISLVAATPEEAERLQRAFVSAGGRGGDPADALMYEPIRACPVRDPFGTDILIFARRGPKPTGSGT